MISGQLKKTFNIPMNLCCQRNVNKAKLKNVINCRYIHQVHVQEQINSKNATVINFPLINSHKFSSDENHHLVNCVHKPLTINLKKSQTSNGDRTYLEKYPSVTTILSNTKTKSEFFSLMQWRKANIEKLGKEKFGLMQRKTTTKGTNFHLEMKDYFSNSDKSSLRDINNTTSSGFFQSVANILTDITSPQAIESAVVHSQLGYAGTVDLVAEYLGKIAIFDWKTSQRKRATLKECYSYPLQLAAYAGAVNYDADYPFQISTGVLVIAYENGDPADIHLLEEQLLEDYWDKWLLRLNKYRQINIEEHSLNNNSSSQNNLAEISTNEYFVNKVLQGTQSDLVEHDKNGIIGDFNKDQGSHPSGYHGPNLNSSKERYADAFVTPNVNGTKEHFADASLTPNVNVTKEHYADNSLTPNVDGTKEHFADASLTPNVNGAKEHDDGAGLNHKLNVASNINGTKGHYHDGTQLLSCGATLNSVKFTSVESHGKRLAEIGRIVKDDDVVVTWHSLSALIESIFGRAFLSKGLLLSHYIRTVFARNLKTVFTPTDSTKNSK